MRTGIANRNGRKARRVLSDIVYDPATGLWTGFAWLDSSGEVIASGRACKRLVTANRSLENAVQRRKLRKAVAA